MSQPADAMEIFNVSFDAFHLLKTLGKVEGFRIAHSKTLPS